MITVSTGSQDHFNSMFFVGKKCTPKQAGMSGDQQINFRQIKGSNEAISYITADDVWV
jgi:hypothetical protein